MQGRIIKGVGGFYEVLLPDGSVVTSKARGRFRNEHLVPMVGDLVQVSFPETGFASIDDLGERKNALQRPAVSNIDQLVIVVSSGVPAPDWLLTDKLLLQAHLLKIEPLLLLNKIDAANEAIVSSFIADYAMFRTLLVSSLTGEGLNALTELLRGRVSCFAGQSAVGKSSLLNALFPQLSLETGELTRKTDRGRHTTRQAELWPLLGGAVLDTPGFSLFELEEISQEELNACWPEFAGADKDCRFASCRHIAEPDCAVKALLEEGKITRARYARYIELSQEIAQRRKHKYD